MVPVDETAITTQTSPSAVVAPSNKERFPFPNRGNNAGAVGVCQQCEFTLLCRHFLSCLRAFVAPTFHNFLPAKRLEFDCGVGERIFLLSLSVYS